MSKDKLLYIKAICVERGENMHRAFLAIDVEKPEVVEKLIGIQQALAESKADLKLVEKENFHITLQFLGDISDAMVEEVYKVMKNVKAEPFTLNLKGVGVFPSLNSPRVIWIGAEKGASKVEEIYHQLEVGLKKLGFRPDKEFTPHLTIARVKTGRNRDALAKIVSKLSEIEIGEIQVEGIRLKKSVLTSSGPIYSTLREVRFGKL
ncbi:MAG: RNA 2',3'-cyclic phosphodiesterase [Candidatus Methanomethylicota archaeon]|uniref:RNA 2',3'-cyclic phosphodiesterase n=1 Tax=Thermoproteota archaeon TaxID=2056631 RepID=A0A497EPU8_9CREN|nr:MAG: RNA 2',3'-cyclic phosphodiesterase [Candidatus Verstraetearchaeota archaeon]